MDTGYGLPVVVDLATGKTLEEIPSPDGGLIEYSTVARDREPGTYLAATVVRKGSADPRYGPRGAKSRIYRLAMDEKGRMTVEHAVSELIEGVIRSIAVSPTGEIAYARSTADKADRYFSFAGILGTDREWPVDDPYRLFWQDESTLVFPSRAEPPWTLGTNAKGEKFIAGGGFLPTVNVRSGATGKLPVPPDLTSYGMVRLAGGRTIWATEVEEGVHDTVSLILYEGPTAIGTVFSASKGKIVSMTLDATGRHVLVGHEIMRATGPGMYDNAVDQKLIQIDLQRVAGLPTPTRSSRRHLDLPQKTVWQGDGRRRIEEITW
ncbi:hypothetical protein [Sphaerimonospora thailandensis]|uniref:Uncharacterized protein n=1 Tax=Sphaerimonospora thailandensis TaxID=795644 RepID=A0A8J3W344_9ACTN|nr:hypothetical protein [Sphaerimonospora thailandensis]GIH73456.1 hypothetical protein Mth01_57090 [Sphaerimonospora thailandensis]